MSKYKSLITDNRDLSIDYLKAIGIMLVIIGHINFANDAVKAWIYSFHMPLFFFSTGLVYSFDSKCNQKAMLEFLKKKANSLLVPYFLWGLIYADFSWQNLLNIIYGSYKTIIDSGSLSSLWFLPTMFVAVNLFQIVHILFFKLNFKSVYSWLFILVFILLGERFLPNISIGYPFCFDVAFVGLGFIILGYLTKRFIKNYLHNNVVKIIVCILFFFMHTIISFK